MFNLVRTQPPFVYLVDMRSHGRKERNQRRVATTAAELALEKQVERKKQNIMEERP